MKRKPLGCLTTGGLIAFVLSLILVGTSYAFTQGKMFSPGKLSFQEGGSAIGGVQSHQDLEEECAVCHPAPFSAVGMTDLCLDCHSEVKEELSHTDSLHGAVLESTGEMDCRTCHTEHKGADAHITSFSEADFPHHLVGFSLNAHQKVTSTPIYCADCHTAGYTDFEDLTCVPCHEQVDEPFMTAHTALFGFGCRACHDGLETYGANFDHNDYPFPLVGKHADVACEDCHLDAKDLAMLQATSQACLACHAEMDVHEGALGAQCEQCHSPQGWDLVDYDHSKTGFSLEGGHADVACRDCHSDQTFQNADPACFSCHASDDPHNGELGTVCETCHVVISWQEVSFDHTGEFAAKCQTCHTGDAPANHYPGQCSICHSTTAWLPATFDHAAAGATDCIACHTQDKPVNHYPGQCSACHTTNAWLPATFDHKTAGATDCISCHTPDKPANHYAGQCSACHSINAWLPASFDHKAAGATDCIACHSADKPANHYSGQCSTCHSTSAWEPASFSHTFPLNHGGANQECTLCHTSTNYSSYTCYGCHEHTPANIQDEHEGISNLNDCVRCHPDGREHDEDGGGEDGDDD